MSARLTPRSPCTAGIATASAHMPMPPRVLRVTLTPRRRQAYVESIMRRCSCCDTEGQTAVLAAAQPPDDGAVQEVPRNAIEESGMIGAGEVEQLAAHPAAARHADDGHRDGDAHARPGFLGREVFAHDHAVARDDAALEQAEQRRHEIEPGEPDGHEVAQ